MQSFSKFEILELQLQLLSSVWRSVQKSAKILALLRLFCAIANDVERRHERRRLAVVSKRLQDDASDVEHWRAEFETTSVSGDGDDGQRWGPCIEGELLRLAFWRNGARLKIFRNELNKIILTSFNVMKNYRVNPCTQSRKQFILLVRPTGSNLVAGKELFTESCSKVNRLVQVRFFMQLQYINFHNWACVFFFWKWAILGLFFIYFQSFHTNNANFTAKQCEKCPSSIWCYDSNSKPSASEFPTLTTRPGLQGILCEISITCM